MDGTAIIEFIGSLAFGAVVGWITYFIMRRAQPKTLSDISTLIGALGGATIIGLFDPKGQTFAGYAIGLALGFFCYFIVYTKIVGISAIGETLMIKTQNDAKGEATGPMILGATSADSTKGEKLEVLDWSNVKKK